MKKNLNALKITLALFFCATLFIACDKDYNEIGSSVIGGSNFNTGSIKYPVTAYNKKTPPVRSNNLPSSLLGVYNDPVYGLSTAHVVAQVVPTIFNPFFGENPQIESVVLSIPYFVTTTGTDDDGHATYEIDSLFGSAPIKLSIFQNNYFLRDLDPETNLEEQQLYYSNANETIDFDAHAGQLLYETDNNGFIPSSDPIIIEELNEETNEMEEVERLSPRFRKDIFNSTDPDNVTFWENLLFDHEDQPELSNANKFKEFFRGLYFKAEAINNDGNMLLLNLEDSGANIVVTYTYDSETDLNENGEPERIENTYTMNITGNKVNVFENNYNFELTDGNSTDGDDLLYLKGGEGSMAVINLFNRDEEGNSTELDEFKANDWLINEANLVFYVNQDAVQALESEQEPDRIYIYNLDTNEPLVDYQYDPTSNTNNPINSKIYHSGVLDRDDDDRGVKYKIRLTEHINNILLRDSLNVQLGVAVTTNINFYTGLKLINSTSQDAVNTLPAGSFLSPRGTILYGSTPNVPEDMRIELEIFYTEPLN